MVGKFVLHNHTSSGETQYYCSIMRLLMCSFEDIGLPNYADLYRKRPGSLHTPMGFVNICHLPNMSDYTELGKNRGVIKGYF